MLSRVDVVVVTWQSADQVSDLLAQPALREVAGVVVVDNASPDGTVDLVRRSPVAVDLVELPDNRGFGAGCNAGLARASHDLVLLLNPDARITAEDLLRLVAHLDGHPACAVAGPRLFRSGEALTSAGRLATARTELRYCLPQRLARWVPERRLPPGYSRTGPVPMLEGACLLVRRQVLRDLGGFDERYFLFFEEHDLARRLAAAGWTCDLVADARAEHAVGTSRAHAPDSARDAYYASTALYLRLWRGPLRAAAYRAVARLSWSLLRCRGSITNAQAVAYRTALSRAGSRP